MWWRRRGPIALAIGILLAGVAGCSTGAGSDESEQPDKVEVFSWWEGPGDKEGYDALIGHFKAGNPNIDFVNAAVAGGAGSNSKVVLASRLEADDPPDSYQVHAGLEQASDIEAGYLEELTYLYERNGWKSNFPKALLDAIAIGGKIYGVPVTVHRSNMLWFNVKTLRGAGIDKPPATWSQFLATAKTLKAKKILPLSIGPGWTQKHLLENVLLGELGAAKYTGLWNGRTSWLAPEVRAAMVVFSKVLAESDIKTFTGDWQSALDKVIAGSAAYTVMGDWADAYLGRTKGLKFKTDYDAVVSPGTRGVFNFLSDTFTLTKGAPHRDAAEKWLAACASPEGQDLLSEQKRSLPANLGADKARYSDYLATALAAWQDPATVVVGSATHGVVVDTARSAEIDTALATFVEDGDIDGFLKSIATTYAGYRPPSAGP